MKENNQEEANEVPSSRLTEDLLAGNNFLNIILHDNFGFHITPFIYRKKGAPFYTKKTKSYDPSKIYHYGCTVRGAFGAHPVH